jgi:cytochrome P450
LQTDPALIPAAIEEVLRYRSPVQAVFRVARQEVELQGQTISSGALVLAMIGSANRDPAHFQEPDRFDVRRAPNPHLAFGHGLHFCIGAALARLEARVALTELLARVHRFEHASDAAWEPRQAFHVHGPSRLPLRFTVR